MSEQDSADQSAQAPVTPEQDFTRDVPADMVETDVNKAEDVVTSITHPVLAVKDLYQSNSAALHAAAAAIATCGGPGRALDDWLGVADKLVDGLDSLAKSSAFPFVGVAVILFKGVVKLETQRRENSKRSRALILQMADMMGALLQLGDVKDPDLKDQRTGQSIIGRVQALMKNIENDIRDCGNLIDTYAKHSFASKFFFSGQYVDKFKSRADGLVSRKGEIIFALQIHNTVGIDEIQAEVKSTNAMLAKLVSIVDHPSSRNEDLDRMMQDLGGRSKVLGDDQLLTTMANAVQARQSKKGASSSLAQDGAKIAGKEDAVLTSSERHELRLPLDSLIEQNAGLYSQKLDAQVTRIVSQLDKLQASSTVILKTITGGAWERIGHPDLRTIWKDNAWHTNVEARLFVLAIHDYYVDLFARGIGASDAIASTTEEEPKADMAPASGDPHYTAASDDDKWCLQYLTVRHTAGLMEVFDADGSGFVRVAEVNTFCESIPDGINLLQWLAYWSAGWKQEAAIYSHRIIQLLKRMRATLGDVLLRNNRVIQRYFQAGRWQRDLDMLLFAAASKFHSSTGTPLDKLVKAEMKRKEDARESLLEKLFYNIDAPESLHLVCSSPRFEADLLPLVYQLLRHHYALFEFSKTKVLDDRELIQASDALTQVIREVKFRIDGLGDAWKQLGFDVLAQFSRYAGGLYEYFHVEQMNGDPEDVYDEDFADDVQTDIEHIVNNISSVTLRFGEWHLDTSGYEHPPNQDSLDSTVVEAETPISPVAITTETDLGLPAETHVRRIVLRLESLALNSRFRFIKPSVQLLRDIALGEHEFRPARLPRILILQMANMLNTILRIRMVENVMLVTDKGDSVLTRLEALMRRIEKDLKDCGHLVQMFRRQIIHGSPRPHSDINRKFKERAEGLERRAQDIANALALPDLKGKSRFRAIVQTVMAQIADARHRKTWAFLKERRDIKKRYVSLVAKQLQAAELQTIWNVKVSLTPREAEELESVSRELLPGDWAYYQSLAQQVHRSTWVHADRKCDSCGMMPIYGVRYLCTVCHDFDLCAKCEAKWATQDPRLPSGEHHASHPLLKISRPIIRLDKYAFAGLTRIHAHLLEGSDSEDSGSGSSVDFSDAEESDPAEEQDLISTGQSSTALTTPNLATEDPNAVMSKNSPSYKPWSFSEVEHLPQNIRPFDATAQSPAVENEGMDTPTKTEHEHHSWFSGLGVHLGHHNEPSPVAIIHTSPIATRRSSTAKPVKLLMSVDTGAVSGKYRCAHCKETKKGIRFVMTQQHRGKQLCPSCDLLLAARHKADVLPDYLRLLLKCEIPPVKPPSSVNGDFKPPAAALASVRSDRLLVDPAGHDRIESLESQVRTMQGRLELLLGKPHA